MYDYAGSFHCHSRYSFDGTTGLEEIIAAAKRQKLDYIVITDHFRMDAKLDGWEGWHDGLLVLVGEEISPRYNHYLALGIEKPIVAWQKEARPQEYIDTVAAQGGIGLIAHPDHTGTKLFGVKDYPWNDWSVHGFDGISIWDLMTDWQEQLTSWPKAVAAYFNPAGVLSGPKKETLARWDTLNRTRRVAGYGEIDNHNSKKKFFGLEFRIFPYDVAFATIRTHAFLEKKLDDNAAVAKRQLMDAVKAARLYIAQERWKSAKGFHVRAYDDTTTAWPGEEFILNGKPAIIEVKLPESGRISFVKDGVTVESTVKNAALFDLKEPGNYRIEVEQKRRGAYKPWIFTNPIRVSKKGNERD